MSPFIVNKESQLNEQVKTLGKAIAIIGSGCRFSGHADTPSKLWDLLENPRDVSSPLPASRFNAAGFYHNDGAHHGHTNVKDLRAYFLSGDGVERKFDANFFGINNAEANVLDPQMRLLLEVTYEALEGAGVTIESLQGTNTGCYVGLMSGEYESAMLKDPETIGTYHATGTARSFLSNRISYFFDWHGPSMTIDTACSSSLVAVHQAVLLLRSGQSRVAIAAGSNMIIDPTNYISESKLQMLSPTGQSRMWDADGNGYARGEGICTLVLKRLEDALADGDYIECVIRETGCNSDGRTSGITSIDEYIARPSPVAQAALIRETYARAGLDPACAMDRPQYFEAHGTGTAAGDPVEAEAIHSAFFGDSSADDGRLLVGSIKTVCGHTEGTAGVAGILKASLALQRGVIPPNLLFNALNPSIKPFVDHLQLATSRLVWPLITDEQPRRASVNSFGFGGTNVHAILESFDNAHERPGSNTAEPVFMPFVFSAASQKSLRNYLKSLASHLEHNAENLRLRDLAYTLHSRRSRFPYALSVVAHDGPALRKKLEELLAESEANGKPIGIRAASAPSGLKQGSGVVAIFTGQGAQWATMGAELLSSSTVASDILEKLEQRLAQLPKLDRPTWSLREELLRAENSRINEPELSQPLCTAIQILLVDISRSAGLKFSAVLGHSSGEVATAYAAGIISAEDAICIAYYRGLCTRLAQSTNGKQGAMMAVGTSAEDASEVLEAGLFKGRVTIAAINSSSSVTLSGDNDAIEDLKDIFEDEEKFVRILRVEKAYHSHHMKPAAESLRQSLLGLEINVKEDSISKSVWVSSVTGQRLTAQDGDRLKSEYWVENLLSPVLFMNALQETCRIVGQPYAVIEIGPHPALRGPAEQTIRENLSSQALESVAGGLGQLWTHAPHLSLELQRYDQFISGGAASKLCRTIPLYVWDHDTNYWHDSRITRAYLHRSSEHELLGHLLQATEDAHQWRQFLSPREISWLDGHRLQGQIVFPAAGYVVLALEAAREYVRSLGESAKVSLLEVQNIDIGQAMTFNNNDAKVEATFRLINIRRLDDEVTADFQYCGAAVTTASSPGLVDAPLRTFATGSILITLGEPSRTLLPARGPAPDNSLPVRTEDLYESLRRMEYGYSGPFYALQELSRRLGAVRGEVMNPDYADSTLIIHPAMLDAAFQAVLLAQAAPYDGTLWSLHVPKAIRRVVVNPALCQPDETRGQLFPLDACQPIKTSKFQGDVDIYPASKDNAHAFCQVEGLDCIPFAPASAKDDKEILAAVEWGPAFPDAAMASHDLKPTREEVELGHLLERLSQFYMQNLLRAIPPGDPGRQTSPIAGIFGFAEHTDSLIRSGDRKFWKSEWHEDTLETIVEAIEPFKDNVDVRLLKRIGENLVNIADGEVTAIEIAMEDHLLNEVYVASLGLKEVTHILARVVCQIAHRYPHLNVLEVGGGTAGCTKAVFSLVDSFASYTFTDVSSAFFPTAQKVFEDRASEMKYQVLDVGKDPMSQGFHPQSYDVIIASMVLHVTKDLVQTMQNIRRLLKPGGYLIIQEGFTNDVGRTGAIFGAFPDWWLGAGEGRIVGPLVSIDEWDKTLRRSGFSGIDTCSSTSHQYSHPTAVFVTQALDDRVSYIRDPLSVPLPQSINLSRYELVIVGGKGHRTVDLITQLVPTLQQRFQLFSRFHTFAELANSATKLSSSSLVLSLAELDQPSLQDLDSAEFEGMKAVLLSLGSIFWVTEGRRASNPFTAMTVGMIRGVVCEVPTLTSQFLDFEGAGTLSARAVATALLRFEAQLAVTGGQEGGEQLFGNLERELVLDSQGQMLIPRLKPGKDMNDRYNSSRRSIFKNLHLSSSNTNETSLKLHQSNAGCYFMEEPAIAAERARFTPTCSLLSAIRFDKESSYAYLSLAKTIDKSLSHVVLSSQLAPKVRALCSTALPTEVPEGMRSTFAVLVAHALVCAQILDGIPTGGHLLVFEPTQGFAAALRVIAKNRAIDVTIIRATPTDDGHSEGYIQINPRSPDRAIAAILPSHKSIFLNCERYTGLSNVVARIMTLRARVYTVQTLNEYFSPSASDHGTLNHIPCGQLLHEAVQYASHYLTTSSALCLHHQVVTLPVADIASGKTGVGSDAMHSVVDWNTAHEIPVKIRNIQDHVFFSGKKTYWLAGLSGGLGLSLCEWMIRRGARHIVITSRDPKIARSWVESMNTLGAEVAVLPCDLTSNSQIDLIYDKICSTMPPLGGVAQGAMVLQDVGFRHMSSDSMEKVLRPKVLGSINLDRLVKGLDLDFFVFFSSATAIIGNAGQSNYSAANMFMTSLAEQRRQRGDAASVIHIGPILGVGYVTQQGEAVRDIFARQGEYTFMAEADFHQLFAEAVAAGRPGSKVPLEICMGIPKIHEKPAKELAWYLNPLSAHMTGNATAEISSKASKSRASVKALLNKATSMEEVFGILKDGFLPALCSLFQLDLTSAGDPHFLDNQIDDFGLDSLLAVEIRTWWLKTLQVNIPVMKILSGITVRDIIGFGVEGLSPELTPNVGAQTETVEENGDATGEDVSTNGIKYVAPARQLPAITRSMELSFNQQIFWFGLTSVQDKTALNHTACYRIIGKLRIESLERAIHHLGQIHDTLRMCFRTSHGQTSLGIVESCTLCVEHQKIENIAEVDAVVQNVHATAYDLEYGETVRFIVLSLSETEHYLVSGSHSLVLDGLSSIIFLRQIAQSYENDSPLDIADIYQYSDWIESQLEAYKCGSFDNSLRFWKKHWSTSPPPLPILRISDSKMRPLLSEYDNFRADAIIGKAVKTRIWAVCRRNKTRPFHFFLATFHALLARFADVEEISIGISDSNRPEQGTMNALGAFANIVPIRGSNDLSQCFSTLMKDCAEKAAAALEHSDVPFHLLLSELGITRSTTYTPMVQAFFDYRQGMLKKQLMGDCELELLSFQASKVPYDICLDIIDDAGEGDCVLHLLVRKDMYTKQQAQTLIKCLVKLTESFSRIPNRKLESAAMFDAQDVVPALGFSKGPLLASKSETVLGLVNHFVETAPNCKALKMAGAAETAMDYACMMHRAKVVAQALRSNGCVKGSIVATHQERSPDWVCSVLGILRAGAICLPLDISLPVSRLAIILQHSEASFVLRQEEEFNDRLQEVCNASGARAMTISELMTQEGADAAVDASPSELGEVYAKDSAMILYTSGSTGTPKGILLLHEGLRNWVEAALHLFDIVPSGSSANATFITEAIAAEGITFTGATPTEYSNWYRYGDHKALLRSTSHWRTAMTGGEATTHATLEIFASLAKQVDHGNTPRLFNVYGPTETTVGATGTELSYLGDFKSANISAGKPLAGYLVYVMDTHLQPVPVGIQGEIVIGGAGVARGYLNDQDLSSERFVSNALVPENYHARGWTTMHRTGDLGRWCEDGTLLVEGRKSGDTQIKLRGLRIDLAEIENSMVKESQNALAQVVVSLRQSTTSSNQSDEGFLVAHAKFQPIAPFSRGEQQEFLNNILIRLPLPQYMRPAAAFVVDGFPMMLSGKLDRKAVAQLPLEQEHCSSLAHPQSVTNNKPLTKAEAQLKRLWELCLSMEISKQYRIDSNSDFFHVGGNSTLMLQLQYHICKEFGVSLTFLDLFQHTTLRAMARRIDPSSSALQPGSPNHVDWKTVTDVPDTIKRSLVSAKPVESLIPRVIAMTGATGLVGQAYLRALICDINVQKVHCIAVRLGSASTKQLLSLHDSPLRHAKVEIHPGDLSEPNLGLDESTLTHIFSTVNVIIHNGADTSHMKSFSSIRKTNFDCTRELINMCLSKNVGRMIPFHYVSTGSVWVSSGLDVADEVSAAAYPPDEKLATGYSASKWASEMFLEKLFQYSGSLWPICIHRPASVQPDGDDDDVANKTTSMSAADPSVIPHLDLTDTLLHYCRLMSCVPVSLGLRGSLNQVSLNCVVQDMMTALRMGPTDHGKLRYIHEIGDINIPLHQLSTVIPNAVEVEPLEWARRAAAAGLDTFLVELFRSVVTERNLVFPTLTRKNMNSV
ncbi:hypothetical protein CFE70_002796 [Pyrenophora teres f. teres 0-1]